MTDVDALALRSAAETMKLNQCKAKIRPGDGLQKLEQVFDLIVTNPPFHQGHQTDTGLSMKLLKRVRNFLHPRGSVVMVVNRHIPYRKWLDRKFAKHQVLAADSNYQVLHAVHAA